MAEKIEMVEISVARLNDLLDLINKYQKSFEKIERYSHFEHHGLEFIRDEVMYVLDKL
jgi:hypothetical protein